MKALFRRALRSLEPDPADEGAAELMRSIRLGECVSVEVKRPRNIQHHRLFFALLNLVFENQEHFKTVDELRFALCIAIGHADPVVTRSGTHMKPRSISFGKMDQAEFNTFFDRAVNFICTEVLPGMDSEALRNEVEEMIR